MPNFCRKCGQPLVSGQCPSCGNSYEYKPSPSAPPPAPAPPMGYRSNGLQIILSGFKSLISSKDYHKIVPAAGFALLAVVTLINMFYTLSTGDGLYYREPEGFFTALNWLTLIAYGAIAYGISMFIKSKDKNLLLDSTAFILLGVSCFLGIVSLLKNDYILYDLLIPSLIILLFGRLYDEKETIWRYLNIIALCALPAAMLINILSSSSLSSYMISSIILYICKIFAEIYILLSYVRGKA